MKRVTAGRKIVVGDVHGCFEELKKLLVKLDFDPALDRLHFTGDLINKGPQSLEVIETALSCNATVVAGNHELRFREAILNGSIEKYQSFQAMSKKWSVQTTAFVCDWIESLPLSFEDPDFTLVHAGFRPGKSVHNENLRILTEIRNLEDGSAWHEHYTGEKCVVYGHWALQGLMVKDNSIGLDSGCVYGNPLTAVIFPERKIFQS